MENIKDMLLLLVGSSLVSNVSREESDCLLFLSLWRSLQIIWHTAQIYSLHTFLPDILKVILKVISEAGFRPLIHSWLSFQCCLSYSEHCGEYPCWTVLPRS